MSLAKWLSIGLLINRMSAWTITLLLDGEINITFAVTQN